VVFAPWLEDLLVGTEANLETLQTVTGEDASADDLIVILGHGTVGSAAAALLRRRRVPHAVVDRERAECSQTGRRRTPADSS
jgi:voltage-gated potassium channel